MTSITCEKCGVANFGSVEQCKRCSFPLNAKSEEQPTTDRPLLRGVEIPEGNFAQPSPPPCIKCGKRQNISIQNFRKIYTSPVAVLGIFLGLLPYILLKLLLRTVHNLTAPFCEDCWRKFRNVEVYNVLNPVFSIIVFIGGIVITVMTYSEWVLLSSVLLPFLTFAIGKYYISTISPKYKGVNAKEVIIDAPFVGEIVYSK